MIGFSTASSERVICCASVHDGSFHFTGRHCGQLWSVGGQLWSVGGQQVKVFNHSFIHVTDNFTLANTRCSDSVCQHQ